MLVWRKNGGYGGKVRGEGKRFLCCKLFYAVLSIHNHLLLLFSLENNTILLLNDFIYYYLSIYFNMMISYSFLICSIHFKVKFLWAIFLDKNGFN